MGSIVHVIFIIVGIIFAVIVGIVIFSIIFLAKAYYTPQSSVNNMLSMREFVEEKFQNGELSKQQFRDAYRMIGYWVSSPWDYVPPECQATACERERTFRKYLSINGIELSSENLDKEKTLAVILDYCTKYQDLVKPQIVNRTDRQ